MLPNFCLLLFFTSFTSVQKIYFAPGSLLVTRCLVIVDISFLFLGVGLSMLFFLSNTLVCLEVV